MRAPRAACIALFAFAGCSPATCRKEPPELPDGGLRTGPDGGILTGEAIQQPAAVERLLARIKPLRKGGQKSIPYVGPTEAEEEAFYAWVRAVAVAARDGGRPPVGAAEGFALEELPDLGLWLLFEEHRRGAGAFAIRTGSAQPLVVEAPHTFFDAGTLPLAVSLFDAQKARALFINTVHRYIARPVVLPDHSVVEEEEDQPQAPSPSDLAHADRSFFLAAHRAVLEVFAGITTVQLHGFQDRSAPGISVIVSAAGSTADPVRLAEPFRAALSGQAVRTYPDEIRKLGGTSNAQARWSAQVGAPLFHIEISRSLRDRLVGDLALRERFAAAFAPVAGEPARPNP